MLPRSRASASRHRRGDLIVENPYPTLKGIQFMLHMLAPQMPQAKSAKPEQFVDISFLNEVEIEGFFAEMARRYPGK